MSDGLSRRSFLKLAATAGAAAAIPGCEPAARKLIPYVVPDENVIPGVPSFYATTCSECPAGCGVVARIREGRVIKLEGNPMDSISGGALCARGQAALQGLYNPDRLDKPRRRRPNGRLEIISWDEATKELNDRLNQAAKAGNDRIAYIGVSQGPTLDNITRKWMASWNSSRVIFWERINNEAARGAAETCFGSRNLPTYRLDKAETIISFDADFTETWGSPVEYSRQYAEFRVPRMRKGGLTIGHSAYVGPRLNATAAKCDEWVTANPGSEAALAMGVLNVVVSQGWVSPNSGVDVSALKQFVTGYDPDTVSTQTGVPADLIKKLGAWFGQADGAVALAGGDNPQVHVVAYILNAVTGNIGRTMIFSQNSPAETTSHPSEVKKLIEAIRDGSVDVVVVGASANPVYSMPPTWGMKEALKRVQYVAWMGEVPDDTSEVSHALMPTHHPLESWRDTNPRAGVYGLGQPVMQPVFASRPLQDVMIESARLGPAAAAQNVKWENAADAVKTEWLKLQTQVAPNATPTDFWAQVRREGGFFAEPQAAQVQLSAAVLQQSPQSAQPPSDLMLVGYPHVFFYDGRGADKPWLQEIPEPVTQIVWDSWVEIHPETAEKLGLKKDYMASYLYAGISVIEISTPNGKFESPVTIVPTVKPGVIAMPMGQGHKLYGRYASARGENAWSYLPEDSSAVPVAVTLTEKKHKLVTPLGDPHMMGRTIVEATSLDDLSKGAVPKRDKEELPDVPWEMYPPVDYPGHKWGMTIDLNSCTGCSACVAACYAENNLAVVGKEGVDRGRIMSWMRMERYIPSQKEDAPYLYIMPMLCQQCDHAPCEPVCPVFASQHTAEGLNAQIYNRCIGTRFCENNCPYKVRRFNWFAPEWAPPLNLQLNPDVTVRGAGVMEKCTFCIQRITYAEINARVEERKVRDGEIIPACAQTCPSRAISFGDINDPESAMMQRRGGANKIRNYTALPSFNAQPAITYLRDVYRDRRNV